MAKQWTAEDILHVARSFQPACVLTAAADLDVFSSLHKRPMTAKALASQGNINPRATIILLDALTAMEFLDKDG